VRVQDRLRLLAGALAFGACSIAASTALAAGGERVAVLPFVGSGGGTTSTDLEAARAATREAVTQIHDVLPSDAELANGERAVKDKVADTSAEYRAAGQGAGATWTLAGHVDVHGTTYRLEIEACQVGTGRVESLAREVDPKRAAPEIAEMLTLLLRPQGVGDAIPPWDQPTTPTPAPAPTAVVIPPAAPPPPVEAGPPPPPLPPYAADHPLALGLGGEAMSAFSRSPRALGSPWAGLVTAHGGYAIDGARWLEIVANVGVPVAGPSALWLDAGARLEFRIVPRARVYAGAELAIGAFVDLGGDKDARFLLRGAIPIVFGIGDRVQIEAYPQMAYAAGGTTGLAFVGGGLRGVVRF
jgi:hypothetical protein